MTRRQLVRRALGVGLSLPVLGGLLAACSAAALSEATAVDAATPPAQAASTRPLTPTFYQWIVDLHPSLPQVNDAFKSTSPLNFQIAPVQGFGIDRFVAESA
jgi:multiple sugar transport system substrate-binding protein